MAKIIDRGLPAIMCLSMILSFPYTQQRPYFRIDSISALWLSAQENFIHALKVLCQKRLSPLPQKS